MAAGFVTKPLSTLLATAARWIEFGDGSTAPVHGSILTDPNTGLPVDLEQPSEIALPASQAFSGSLTGNGVIGPFNMDAFSSFNLRVADVGGGATVTAQASFDEISWTTVSVISSVATSNNDAQSTVTAVGVYQGGRFGPYLQFVVSAYTNGTVSILGEMSVAPPRGNTGSVQAQGATAHGGNVSTKPVRGALRSRTPGSPITATTADQTTDATGDLFGHQYVRPPARAAFTSSQVPMTTSAAVIVSADTARLGGLVRNTGASTVYIGGSGVTSSSGFPLVTGADLPNDVLAGIVGAIYGITASGSSTVGVITW